MKLALLVEYYPPSRTSAAVQMSDLAGELARQGHAVTVFTTSPQLDSPLARDEAPGLTVLRVPTGKVKGLSLARRAINEIVMPLALWRGARCCGIQVGNFDGIVWYSPTIFLGPFVAWLKVKSRAPTYLILRDIFPQWALDAGIMRRGPAYYFFKAFESFQYRIADVIGVQSPANLRHFEKASTCKSRLDVLHNWMKLDRPEPEKTDMLQRYGLVGKHILVYGGNMGVAQDVDNLLRLAGRVRDADQVILLLVGNGSEVARMRRVVSDCGLINVVFADEVDPDEFRSLLRMCHVGLITLDRRLTTHNIPGKLLAYLEAGLPVIASVNAENDLLTILFQSGAGIGFTNGEDREFAEAVLSIIGDPDRRALMSENARALAKASFSVDSIARQLVLALTRDYYSR